MPARFPTLKSLKLALILAAIALPGCAVGPPPVPASNPADPSAPAAATAPLRPTLLATSRNYLSSLAHDRQQKAKETDMSKMKGHDMSSMSRRGIRNLPHSRPPPALITPARCIRKSRKRKRANVQSAG